MPRLLAMFMLAAAMLCASLLATRSVAQPDLDAEVAAPRTPRVLREAASRVPDDVTTLIVADDLSSVRREAAGEAALEVIETLGAFAESRGAWNELAARMETTPRDAFDALLGSHVMFITREAAEMGGEAPGVDWALMSRVSIASAKRLGVALKATPRSEQGGLPIFSLENGAFLLHIRSDAASRTAWITVGPGARPELFRQMTAAPPGGAGAGKEEGAGTLIGRPAFMSAIAALPEAADAFVYRRLGVGDRGVEFVAGAVRIAGGSAVISYTTNTSPGGMPASGWSRPVFDGLTGGGRSLITLVTSGPTTLGRLVPKKIESIRPLFPVFERQELLGDRASLSVMNTPGGAIGVAFAVETPDAGPLTDPADRYMADFLGHMFPAKLNAQQRLDVTGLAPRAMRTVNMQGAAISTIMQDPAGPICGWVVTTDARGEGLPPPKEGEPAPGWWVSGIDPPTIARSVGVLTAPAEAGEWAALGLARPRELAEQARRRDGLLINRRVLAAMDLIDRMTLAERWLTTGRVVGSVSVDFTPPKGQ